MKVNEFTNKQVSELSAILDEPEWMFQFRLEALEKYHEITFPTARDESWRRTNPRKIKWSHLSPSREMFSHSHMDQDLTDLLGGMAGIAEETDRGMAVRRNDQSSDRVIFTDIHTAIRENGDLLQEFLMKDAVAPVSGKFAALHAAFLRGGALLYVPKGVSAGMYAYRRRYDSANNSFSHLLVVLEEGAEASLYVDSESVNEKADAFHVGVTEMIVGRNARLNLVHRQNWADNLVNISHEKAVVQQDAVLNWSTASFGSRLTKTFQIVDLAGKGAEASMNGLLFGDERQHIDLETEQNHLVPNTMSDLLYKGALDGNGRSVWRGMIRVLPEAQKTNGYQANRNLLLSSTARADSIPGLEIEADDVRCTHGTTVSTVNEDEVFYAMTRGLPRHEAVRLLVRGFYSPVMERVPLESIRRILWDTIDSRISNHSLPTS